MDSAPSRIRASPETSTQSARSSDALDSWPARIFIRKNQNQLDYQSGIFPSAPIRRTSKASRGSITAPAPSFRRHRFTGLRRIHKLERRAPGRRIYVLWLESKRGGKFKRDAPGRARTPRKGLLKARHFLDQHEPAELHRQVHRSLRRLLPVRSYPQRGTLKSLVVECPRILPKERAVLFALLGL